MYEHRAQRTVARPIFSTMGLDIQITPCEDGQISISHHVRSLEIGTHKYMPRARPLFLEPVDVLFSSRRPPERGVRHTLYFHDSFPRPRWRLLSSLVSFVSSSEVSLFQHQHLHLSLASTCTFPCQSVNRLDRKYNSIDRLSRVYSHQYESPSPPWGRRRASPRGRLICSGLRIA
jgi:hypothetical protein